MTLYFFYFFSFIVILSSFLVIFVSNPVHSVLFLIFTFFNAAIIFLIFKAEFLAMTLLIVYVGAVAVLFLFVVMMLNISESIIKEGFLRYFPFGLLLISIFLIELFMIFNSDKIIFPESGLLKINEIMNLGMDNTKSLGLFLYTDYFIIFQKPCNGPISVTCSIFRHEYFLVKMKITTSKSSHNFLNSIKGVGSF